MAGSTFVSTNEGTNLYDAWLLKLYGNGEVDWHTSYTYGTAAADYDYALSVQPIQEEGYIIAGYTASFGNGDNDLFVLRVDDSGDIPGCTLPEELFTPQVSGNHDISVLDSSIEPLDTQAIVTIPSEMSVSNTSIVPNYFCGAYAGAPNETPLREVSMTTGCTQTYTWLKAPNATRYDLQVEGPTGKVVEESYEASPDVCFGGTCSVVSSASLMNAEYTWQIRTGNMYGEGEWSAPMDFMINHEGCVPPSDYFVYDQWGDTWHDAEKSLLNPGDDWMCWAAAAANILDWTGWITPLFDSEQDIFQDAFLQYWTNAGSLMEYAWNWWFDGTSESPVGSEWSQFSDGGGYWSEYDFFDYFYENWAGFLDGQWNNGSGLLATIDDYLHQGYGTTLAVYTEDGGGHALTVWGYEYDTFGDYTGLWVTDSDDYMDDLKLLSLALVDDLWYLDRENIYGYQQWFIGGVQALDRNPIPEPGTLILFGVGLTGFLILWRRKQD